MKTRRTRCDKGKRQTKEERAKKHLAYLINKGYPRPIAMHKVHKEWGLIINA